MKPVKVPSASYLTMPLFTLVARANTRPVESTTILLGRKLRF